MIDLLRHREHSAPGLDTAAKSETQQILRPVRGLPPFHAGITFLGRVVSSMPRKMTNEEFIASFWSAVEKKDNESCWLWKRAFNACGYGITSRGLAHRQAWAFTYGPIAPGKCVLHRCDVPACVNPHHLFIGSQQDNIADMVSKHRQRAPRKLTEDDVRWIRAYHDEKRQGRCNVIPGTVAYLVQRFRVDCSQIHRIVKRKGKSWKHLTP